MTSSAPTAEPLQRGDIVVVADRLAEFAGKPRPAVVLQSPQFALTTVTFCLITSIPVEDAPLLRIALPATPQTGLEGPSWVQIDRVTTLRRTHVRQRIGRLDSVKMFEISQALLVFLGIADAAGH
jgi:mRNA interferase MazF